MNKKQNLGKYGEDIAVKYLKNRHYIILERNFRSKQGEIDIIAKDNNELIFIEVKTRRNLKYGTPAEAVDNKKIQHIYNTANLYLKLKNVRNIIIRFDIIEVYILNNRYCVNHIKQIL